MTRVCVVAPKYMTGGQAIEARTLVHGFAADDGIKIELQPIDPRIPALIARIPVLRTLARMPLFWIGLIRRVATADVVHVFTAAFWPFLLTTTPAVLVARSFGRPVVLNYRDGRAARHIGRPWVRWVLRRATLLVFPSGFLQALFQTAGFDGLVIHNVVETGRFRFRRRSPCRPIMLSCRLLEELYAVENTIRAYAIVKERNPDARLIVIGDGDQRGALERLVQTARIRDVEFHGAVRHAEVAEWFDRADILLNSSRIDNMPHALLEAFAAGLPVVTTPAGGIPYIVEHGRNGLCVPVDDSEAMAAAVLNLLRDPPLVERLVAGGRADCARYYAWPTAKSAWRTVYSSLARTPGNVAVAGDTIAPRRLSGTGGRLP